MTIQEAFYMCGWFHSSILIFSPFQKWVCRTMTTSIHPWTPKFAPVGENASSGDFEKELAAIRVISYNILAQAYVKSSLFPHSPSPALRWKARSQAILQRLLSFNADFLCIQELDEFESFFKRQLDNQGYGSLYAKRPGKKYDGCGIFFRHERFELLWSEVIDYNDLVPVGNEGSLSSKSAAHVQNEGSLNTEGISLEEQTVGEDTRDLNDPRVRLKRDCVGVIGAFRVVDRSQNLIILANTHLYWDPDLADVKLAQAKYLVSCVCDFKETVAREFCCTPPLIICGDFNSTPGDKVYNYLTSGSEERLLPNVSEGIDFNALPERCPLALYSLYAFVKEEPVFTNFTPDFTGTLDYLFFSSLDHLRPKSVLELPLPSSPDICNGLPNYNHPSDHLPIGGDFSLF
eukprot:c19190_g1_i1 orf=281-1489(-)